MPETATVAGLVALIALLIDLGAKVASRLHELPYHNFEVPESFRALSTRLQLLSSSLRPIAEQAQAGRLPPDVVDVLQAVITSTSTHVTFLQTCLSHNLPSIDASHAHHDVNVL